MRRIMLLLTVAAVMVIMTAVAVPVASAAPATGKDVCKNGGWATLGLGFENQGQCIAAANQAAHEGLPFPPPIGCIVVAC